MPSESSVQKYLLEKLNTIENSEWEKATVTNKAGSPDVKGHIHGYYIAIEVKRDDSTGPTELQEYRIEQTIRKGGLAFWTASWEYALYRLLEYSDAKDFSIVFRSKVGHTRYFI